MPEALNESRQVVSGNPAKKLYEKHGYVQETTACGRAFGAIPAALGSSTLNQYTRRSWNAFF